MYLKKERGVAGTTVGKDKHKSSSSSKKKKTKKSKKHSNVVNYDTSGSEGEEGEWINCLSFVDYFSPVL